MNKKYIIQLWKDTGWNTLWDYHNHLKSPEPHLVLNALDPDRVDPREFWTAAEEHFATDPVCNHNNLKDTTLSIQESNKTNYKIPLNMGMIAQTEWLVSELKTVMKYASIAEIGCGYGSFFENFFEWNKHQDVDYRGFDIIARTPSALEVGGHDGTFSQYQVNLYKEKINLFYSSNTFQHLSRLQIIKYLKQVYEILPYGGYFNLMYVMDAPRTYHYGQVVYTVPKWEMKIIVEEIGYEIIATTKMKIPNSLTPYTMVLKK